MPRNKKYKIAVKGGYGLHNFGDDALIYVLYSILSEIYSPNDILIICGDNKYMPDQIKGLSSKNMVYFTSKHKDFEVKHLIFGGGTQFYSFKNDYRKGLDFYFFKGLIQPHLLISDLLTKLKLKNKKTELPLKSYEKTHLLGVGFGPFFKGSRKDEAKRFLSTASTIIVRDEFSKEFAETVSESSQEVIMLPDLCFINKYYDIQYVDKKISKPKKIGIILRDWTHDQSGSEYLNNVLEFEKTLADEGYKTEFILFSKRSDIICQQKLLCKKNVSIYQAENTSIESYSKYLGGFDMFITSRFHGAVFASLLGIPFITVAVDQKLVLFSEKAGLNKFVWKPDFDTAELHSLFNVAVSDFKGLKDKVKKFRSNEIKEAAILYDKLIEILGKWEEE